MSLEQAIKHLTAEIKQLSILVSRSIEVNNVLIDETVNSRVETVKEDSTAKTPADVAEEIQRELKTESTEPPAEVVEAANDDSAEPVTAVDFKDMRSAMIKVSNALGKAKGLEILDTFNAKKLGAVPMEAYADVVRACEEALNNAA